jgi:hypothetical protein
MEITLQKSLVLFREISAKMLTETKYKNVKHYSKSNFEMW